jgi:AraC-like DNA-binding protein
MREWSILRYDPDLKIDFLHAFYTTHAYPLHSHDYYVICLIEQGVQSCVAGRSKDITLPGGIILLNPGEPHSGQSASENGFEYRALYPTSEHMQLVREGLAGSFHSDLSFDTIRLYDRELERALRRLHLALHQPASPLERESRFVWTLTRLMERYMRPLGHEQRHKREPMAIKRAKAYIEAHYAQGVSLKELAAEVALSPYHFLRVFRNQVGMPPHAYLETVRIRAAQALLERGDALSEVAYATGFSTQAHFTERFKRIIGVTPGRYVQHYHAF